MNIHKQLVNGVTFFNLVRVLGVLVISLITTFIYSSAVFAAPTPIITEYDLPTAYASPAGIASGPDGNLWFTEAWGNKIGKITPSGVITEYDVPTPGAGPQVIILGPDGNLWFTEVYSNKIGKITPYGVITEYDVPTPGGWSRGYYPWSRR